MEKRESKQEPIDEIHEQLSFVEYTTFAAKLELQIKPVEQVQEQDERNK